MPSKGMKGSGKDGLLKKASKKKKKGDDNNDYSISEIISSIAVMSKGQVFVENNMDDVRYPLVGTYYDPSELKEKELRKKLDLTDSNVDYALSKAVFSDMEEETKENEEDIYLNKTKKKQYHARFTKKKEESEDELNIEKSDSLVLSGKICDGYGTLEIHVFNYEDSVFNIYDDIIVDAPPLCLEIIEQKCYLSRYLVAIGTLNSSIGLWDLKTSTDTMEPVAYLGDQQVKNMFHLESENYKKKKDKKKDRKHKNKIGKEETCKKKGSGHKKCVNCLSYSKLKRDLLCSGSKDKTIKLWDLNTLSPVCTYKNHKKRVNTVHFHPTNTHSLLSTSLDKTFKLYDTRNGNVSVDIPLEHKPESCVWNTFNDNVVFLSDTKGYISQIDIRKASSNGERNGENKKNTGKKKMNDAVVTSFQAFNNPCVSVLSTNYQNLVLAASEKGQIVAYDFGNIIDDKPISIFKRKMKRQMHCMAITEDCPNVIFLGSNTLFDWDLKTCPELCSHFGI